MKELRIIIVGGGALGLSACYHLLEMGVKKITLIERGALFEGSSGKSAGIVSHQLWNSEDVKLVKESLSFFELVEKKSGGILRLMRKGMLRLVESEDDAENLLRSAEELEALGVKVMLMKPKEVKASFPSIYTEDLLLGLYTPEDLYIDPGGYAYALYSYMKGKRVRFLLYEELNELIAEGDRITGVVTNRSKVEGDLFLVCTGGWTKEVLASLGIKLPLKLYMAQAGVLKPRAPLSLPILHDCGLGFYLREEPGGLILFGDGSKPIEGGPYRVPSQGTQDFIEGMAESISKRVPELTGASIVRTWTGVCTGTPDRRPLIGKIRPFENLFAAAGLNGFGFMRAPALGRLVATLMLEGKLPKGFEAYSLERIKDPEAEFEVREGFTIR
jgi:sarcosine oxidase subunit beta